MLSFRKNNLDNIELCKFLGEIGFNEEEILNIIFDPSFFITYYDKVDVMVRDGYKYLVGKKFLEEQIRKMILRYPGILTFSDEKKDKVEEYFKELGISLTDFRKVVYRCPNIYGYTIERTKGYVEFFKKIGYSDDEIKHIIKNSGSLFNRSVLTLKKFINDMELFGFDIKDILCIGKNYPLFWTCSFDKVKLVIDELISLGFEKKQVINILVNASSLVGYDVDTIKNKFNEIINLGFDKDEVVLMISTFPVLIVCDIERTRNIVEFFTSIGLKDKIFLKPKSIFKQSIEASYARYMFFKDMKIDINEETYGRLFFGWTWFKKKYGVTRDGLLERYPYVRQEVPQPGEPGMGGK